MVLLVYSNAGGVVLWLVACQLGVYLGFPLGFSVELLLCCWLLWVLVGYLFWVWVGFGWLRDCGWFNSVVVMLFFSYRLMWVLFG